MTSPETEQMITIVCEQLILEHGPLTLSEIQSEAYMKNWLMIGGYAGEYYKAPFSIIKETLSEEDMFMQDDSGRFHLTSHTADK